MTMPLIICPRNLLPEKIEGRRQPWSNSMTGAEPLARL